MQSSIAYTRKTVALALSVVMAVIAVGVSGGFSALQRVGDASLEFGGNLISTFHNNYMDRLDPMYPHCF